MCNCKGKCDVCKCDELVKVVGPANTEVISDMLKSKPDGMSLSEYMRVTSTADVEPSIIGTFRRGDVKSKCEFVSYGTKNSINTFPISFSSKEDFKKYLEVLKLNNAEEINKIIMMEQSYEQMEALYAIIEDKYKADEDSFYSGYIFWNVNGMLNDLK